MNMRMSLLSGAMVLALSVPAAAQYQTTPAQPATPGTVTELAPGAVGPGMMASTQAQLSLRAGPGTEHATISVIPQGATVEVQECLAGWCEITYAGMTGYASQAHLASDVAFAPPASAAPPAAAALAPPTFEDELAQATSDLNLRAGPGLGHSPIGVIPEGATVEILDCLPDRVWCEVSYAGMTGYASERYLATGMDFDRDMGFAADVDVDGMDPEPLDPAAVNGELPAQ
jgi:uncharacterized protein YraI